MTLNYRGISYTPSQAAVALPQANTVATYRGRHYIRLRPLEVCPHRHSNLTYRGVSYSARFQ